MAVRGSWEGVLFQLPQIDSKHSCGGTALVESAERHSGFTADTKNYAPPHPT